MMGDQENEGNALVVIWTSQDPEVAENMVFMYAKNARARGWWDDVRLVIWGPSANLAASSPELQKQIRGLADAGVEILACKACADNYGVAHALEDLGISVMYMGEPLTQYLKAGLHVITF